MLTQVICFYLAKKKKKKSGYQNKDSFKQRQHSIFTQDMDSNKKTKTIWEIIREKNAVFRSCVLNVQSRQMPNSGKDPEML